MNNERAREAGGGRPRLTDRPTDRPQHAGDKKGEARDGWKACVRRVTTHTHTESSFAVSVLLQRFKERFPFGKTRAFQHELAAIFFFLLLERVKGVLVKREKVFDSDVLIKVPNSFAHTMSNNKNKRTSHPESALELPQAMKGKRKNKERKKNEN